MDLLRRLSLSLLISLICIEASNIREGRITNGREAEPHSNPFVVSLQSRFYRYRYRLCTGSILSERWILSAGHCVMDSWARWLAMDAIVGAHNLEYIRSSQIYPIERRIAHPMYRGGVGPYDIAMMRTSRDIEFSPEVQPISLPLVPPRDETTRDLLITGWGALQSTFFVTVLPNKLQEAEVTYLPYYECYRAVDKLKEYYEPNPLKRIHNLCTGIPKTGRIAGCTGDSGGPLVQYIPVTVPENEITVSTTDTEVTTTPITSTTSRKPSSTTSPTPMTTERTTTSTTNASPTPVSTDRTSTTTEPTMSPTPMTTDRTSTTTFQSPTPVSTDRTSTSTSPTIEEISTPSTPSVSVETTSEDTTLPEELTTDDEEEEDDMRRRILNYNKNVINKDGFNSGLNSRALRVNMVPTVIGVISWGVVPCGKMGAPTVYSNVTNYMDFITKYLSSD